MTEKEKMLAGALYLATDAELVEERRHARQLLARFNGADPSDSPARRGALVELLGTRGKGAFVEPPFRCDYGYNIHLGEGAYFNFDCVLLDGAPIRIGARTLFGPGVHVYAATHPTDTATRRAGLELALPVTIGADVWVGGGAILLPGVTVGDGAVIGAGSVVTRSVPPGVLAVGNPCRVIREV